MKKAQRKNVQLAVNSLIEALTILSHKGIVDVDIATNFIKKDDLQGLQGYLEGIRLKVEK
ncbi:hypothetical protein [Peribacillus frigoritolerans]|uniref:hypothetical protein n=1 Tax=Peribacillus frigoritolerans TaxID=450367 RepID=UPI002163CC08|nr:hypothetical protein [Peribacillus frigoritolerans]